MDGKKTPEPPCCYGKTLLGLARCVGWAGIRAQVESSGAALAAHEQCQGAAGAGEEQHEAGMWKDPAQQGQAPLT